MKYSIREICKRLGFAYSTVRYTINRFQDTGTNLNRPGRGRFECVSQSEKRYLKLLSTRFRTKTLPMITKEFNIQRRSPISMSCVRRVLLKWGLKGPVTAKKTVLRPRNIRKRLIFAKDHLHWTKEQWANVIFNDESKFELFGTKRRVFVRRQEGEKYKKSCIVPTVKHGGGSVMVWGGISVKGSIPLKRIEGIMDKKVSRFNYVISKAIDILKNNTLCRF